ILLRVVERGEVLAIRGELLAEIGRQRLLLRCAARARRPDRGRVDLLEARHAVDVELAEQPGRRRLGLDVRGLGRLVRGHRGAPRDRLLLAVAELLAGHVLELRAPPPPARPPGPPPPRRPP